ncbi:MAG: phage portal protein [Bacteroidaceae bacterium]|nr:phage portal protein [Bacteroidaceae bacterium]
MLSTQEILRFITEDKESEKKLMARKGVAYYEGRHDIEHYKLYFYNADGNLVEDENRSNIKISHPFFTELVDQATQYVLSGDDIFKSDIPELQNLLDEYFNYNEDFMAELNEVITGAQTKGFDYMFAYKKEDGTTGFMCADSIGVVEVRAKDTDDNTDYVIYWYVDRIEKGQKKIKRIEVWDANQTYYYVQEQDGEVQIDTDEPINPRPHIVKVDDKGDRYDGGSYGVIPFFRLDNNKKQVSDLKLVKALIDDYDLMACGLSNNIQDASEYLVVVKSFQGDNMEELMHNIKTKKHIGVDGSEGGDVEFKTVDIPFQARQVKLELDEKNIYRFGFGLNTAGLKDTSATTNIAIKSAYSLLDMKANKIEIKLKQFLRKILKLVIDEINAMEGTDYQSSDVYFEFDHEVMSNEQENAQIDLTEAQEMQVRVNTLMNVASMLDNETVLMEICDVLDIDYEEIKGRLPMDDAEAELADAQNTLDTAQEGISEGEMQTQNEVLTMLDDLLKELG